MEAKNMEALVRSWTESFSEEVLDFARPQEVSNEEVFAEVYHSLIHSSISSTLVQLEHSHASTIEEKVDKMESSREDNVYGDEGSEEQQIQRIRQESDLSHLRDTQYREFREWVMCVHEEFNDGNGGGVEGVKSGVRGPNGSFKMGRSESSFSIEANSAAPVFQESFTITLGAQMKQMHNLRLVAADALDLCRYSRGNEDDSLPQRLQTSMSLYSNNLCGLVLLTETGKKNRGNDTKLDTVEKEVAKLCNRSTEFHFPTFEEQLDQLFSPNGDSSLLKKCYQWRKEHWRKKKYEENPENDDIRKEEEEKKEEEEEEEEENQECEKSLQVGDFFVTRHSNLCEVHVLFHVICDYDSVLSGNINSRHPVIMAMRNVLKTASLSDVTTLTLPLLLTLEMNEVMTVAWCMKRAELVFKCVKGFMMEVASWGGADIKTLQFLVPKDINQDVFNKLTSMLAGIFRTSNPIRCA